MCLLKQFCLKLVDIMTLHCFISIKRSTKSVLGLDLRVVLQYIMSLDPSCWLVGILSGDTSIRISDRKLN